MRWLKYLLWIGAMDISAQENIRVKTLDVDQGLPMNTVWDIVQDRYGFLWVSTADGLSRFDGYTFHNYRTNSQDSTAIHGQAWHSMALDSTGNIWMAHENGIDRYDFRTGKFQLLYQLPQPRTIGLNKFIGQDDQGNLYIWIIDVGLVMLNTETQKSITFKPGSEHLSRMVRDGCHVGQGKFWMVQSVDKIIEFDTKKKLFNELNLPENWQALSILTMDDSTVLVGTMQGLLRYKSNTHSFQKIGFDKVTDAKALAPIATTSILKVSSQLYWVGTNKGLFIYNDGSKTLTKHIPAFSPNEKSVVIQKLYQDKSGNIWIATNGNGLKRYAPHAPQWKLYRANQDQNDIVKSIYVDEDFVYIGYFQKGLEVFSKQGRLLKTYNKSQGLPSENVYAIKPFSKSELFLSFLGTTNNNFGILNIATNKFTSLDKVIEGVLPKPLPASNPFPAIIVQKNSELLFNWHSHLIKLNADRSITLIKSFNEIISTIYQGPAGLLWIGTMQGLYQQNLDGSWRKITAINKQVKTIEQSADGTLWVGTISGLYIISQQGALLAEHHTGKNLVNDFIYGILRDNKNNMWFSHNRGITRYNPQTKTFKHFSSADGLQANEFNTGAFFKDASGELFFGGVKGTNSFSPKDIYENPHLPQVRITNIEVNDKPYTSKAVYWATQEVVMQYPQNTLALEVTGLEFTEPIKNQYRWRLTSVDDSWIQAETKRQTRYANLASGQYIFEVEASNNDGLWNEKATTLTITVLPPWWETWWFKSIVVVVLVAIIALTAYLISRQRYKRKINELLIQQKIQKDRDRISRDLHDNVGSMVSFVSSKADWLIKNHGVSAEAAESLQQIKTNASTIMAGLRETIWAISDKPITNTDLADKLKVYLKAHLLVHCHVSDDILTEAPIPNETALHIYRSCQEIINNINKHSQATLVTVAFTNKHSTFEVTLRDNGIGITQADLNKEGHYGLKNIQERLQQVNSHVEVNSSDSGTEIMIMLGSAKSLLK